MEQNIDGINWFYKVFSFVLRPDEMVVKTDQ